MDPGSSGAPDPSAGYRPAAEARLVSVSAWRHAATLARLGTRVARHRGHYWRETRPGFFEGLHPLARVPARDATRPALRCWGYRAVLREEDAARANATLPLHLLEDLAGFDEGGLSPRRRNKLRRARRDASLVQLEDPRLFREQGYRLYVSHLARTRHKRVPSEEEFLAATGRLFASHDTLVLAAIAGGRLGGWVHGYAVEGTAYLDDVVVGSDFLGLQLGLALNVELILAARRGAGIERLVHGFHAREDRGLDEFKAGLGLKVVHVPTRLSLPRPVRWALEVARPHVLYRLTGR